MERDQAQIGASQIGAASTGRYLAFTVMDETYGVELLGVREIIEYAKPTTVPMMPGFMLGVINLRGHVVPVIDLGRRVGADATAIHKRSAVVILELGSQSLGVVVDAVDSVLDLDAGQIEPSPRFGAGMRREFIKGMAKTDEGGFVVLLDIGRVFATEELAAQAASGRPLDVSASYALST